MRNDYFCALDIGSSKIAAAAARIHKRRIGSLVLDSVASKGVCSGEIVNALDLTTCIAAVMKGISEKTGVKPRGVYAGISGADIVCRRSRAIIPLADKGNKIVTLSDVRRVNEQARILGSNLEEEIIYQLPVSYAIDSNSAVANPLGLYSHRLEVDLLLVSARLSSIQSLTRAVEQAGCELRGVFHAGLATSEAVFSREALAGGVHVLCDIGNDSVELAVLRNGTAQALSFLPVGSDMLTRTLSQELKIPLALAEELKLSYAAVIDPLSVPQEKEVLLRQSSVYKPIRQRLIVELVTAAAGELCRTIGAHLSAAVRPGEVSSVILVGRAALLDGMLELLEQTLQAPVRLGRIVHPDILPLVSADGTIAGQRGLSFVTALGVLVSGLKKEFPVVVSDGKQPQGILQKLTDKIREVYQEYF